MGPKSNDNNYTLEYSFNTTQNLSWRTVTISQGSAPPRKEMIGAVTDNNDKIYIFAGGLVTTVAYGYYNSIMDIFDTTNKIWTSAETGLVKRDGHTSTFLPDTGDIIYIGGITPVNDTSFELVDITNLDVYNTITGVWNKWKTTNPPEPRYGHTAVLTNDMRIIVFGGARVNITLAVFNRYVVLDVKTLQWYHGKEDPSTKAPFRLHTATLYNDYMFIAFGYIVSTLDNPISNDVLIYKIGDYANFTEVSYFINKNAVEPTFTSPSPQTTEDTVNKGVIIGATFGSIFAVIILGVILFIIFKRYKKPQPVIRVA